MRVLATGGGAVAPEPRMRSDDKRLHLKKHLRIVELATTKAELASAPAASDSFMGEVEDLPIQEREA